MRALAGIGRARGWIVIGWITAVDYARARKLYDRLATRTQWVTHDLKLWQNSRPGREKVR